MNKVWIILANSAGELDRQSIDMEWPIKAADQICDLIRTWTLQPGDVIRVEEFDQRKEA